MNPWQANVEAFHKTAGQTIGETPALRNAEFRARLIAEEAKETLEAITGLKWKVEPTEEKTADGPGLADALDGFCDLIYVILGSAIEFGIRDLQPYWDEVQRSNMDKFPGGICTRNEFGKVTKPKGWKPPDIAGVLERMRQGMK